MPHHFSDIPIETTSIAKNRGLGAYNPTHEIKKKNSQHLKDLMKI
jgi:hypothetical protein